MAINAENPNPKPSSNPGDKLVSEHGIFKADLATVAKLKVSHNRDLKIDQGLDSTSIKALCDQLAKTLHQLTNQTEQAEENKLKEMLGNNSKALDEFSCLLHDLSTRVESEEKNDISDKMVRERASGTDNLQTVHTRLGVARELMSLLEGKLQQTENENALVKKKQIEISERWQICSLLKTLRDQLTETPDELASEIGTESRCNERRPSNNFGSYQIHCKKDCSSMATRIQQDNEHESTRWACNKDLHCIHPPKHKLRKHGRPTKDIAPGNTATIVLNPENFPASKRSFRKGIRKVRAWCRANSKVHDLSHHFGPGAEAYTTPGGGTFHLSFEYKGRRITFFIYGLNLYLMGWESDEHGMFELNTGKVNRFILDPSCTVLKLGVNYHDLTPGGVISDVRLGPCPMMEKFDVLHKCSNVSDEVKKAIALFAVNISEAIRFQCIFKKVLRSFDNPWTVFTLGWFLASKAKNYGHYSKEYLKCLECIINRQPVPQIQNRGSCSIKSVDELRTIRVPLKTVYNHGEFKYDTLEPAVWSPPYPDGKDWVSDDEEYEEGEQDKEFEEGLDEECQHEKEQDEDQHPEEGEEIRKQKLLISSFSHHFPVLKMTDILSRIGTSSEIMEDEQDEEKRHHEVEDKEPKKLWSSCGEHSPVLRLAGSISRIGTSSEIMEEEDRGHEVEDKEPKKPWDHSSVLRLAGSISRFTESAGDHSSVLRLAGSISRFTESAGSGRISCIGQYCLRGTANATCPEVGTVSGIMKVVQFKSRQSVSPSICSQAWRATRFLLRLL